MCPHLIHVKEASLLIQKLVDCSLLVNDISDIHFDPPQPLLSDKFILELANNDVKTHSLGWPNELRIKLFTCYDQLFDLEILDCIDTLIHVQSNYITLKDLQTQFMRHELIQLVSLSPYLCQRLKYHVSNYIVQFQNWKLTRLGQCMNHCLPCSLKDQCTPIVTNASHNNVKAQTLHSMLSNYIFSGDIQHISQRRSEAWCLSLSFHRFLWYCIYQLVQYCKQNTTWTQQVK
jgi:hypothetical protein